jgi:uncharacterized protein YutE (UPF0331/DUF86 family)
MINQHVDRERHKRLEVARAYRRKGYLVVLEPSAADVPFELKGYKPDLVVRSKDGKDNAIIEITTRDDINKRLAGVAAQIEKHEKWRFEVSIIRSDKDKVQENVGLVEAKSRLDSAERLHKRCEYDAALLIAWSGIECLLRESTRTVQLEDGAPPTSPAVLIKNALSVGVLSQRDYDQLESAWHARSAVAHGFKADYSPKAALGHTLRIGRKILDHTRST